jgi:hypothetical protein
VGRSLLRRGSLATVASRLAVRVALTAIAAPAAPVAAAAPAFALALLRRTAWLSLRDGRLRRVDRARFLSLTRFALRPLPLRIALIATPIALIAAPVALLAAPIAIAARLLLAGLRLPLLLLFALLAALTVAARFAAFLSAGVALLVPARPIAAAVTAIVARLARRFPTLRSLNRLRFLARLAPEPAHDRAQPVFALRNFGRRSPLDGHRRGMRRGNSLDRRFLARLARFLLALLDDVFLFRALDEIE